MLTFPGIWAVDYSTAASLFNLGLIVVTVDGLPLGKCFGYSITIFLLWAAASCCDAPRSLVESPSTKEGSLLDPAFLGLRL